MNIEFLLKVKADILANPETYNQMAFCDSAHCIAGHAVSLGAPDVFASARRAFYGNGHDYDGELAVLERTALELMGLELPQYRVLCSSPSIWPIKFARRYECAATDSVRAQVAADFIDWFIAAEGTE